LVSRAGLTGMVSYAEPAWSGHAAKLSFQEVPASADLRARVHFGIDPSAKVLTPGSEGVLPGLNQELGPARQCERHGPRPEVVIADLQPIRLPGMGLRFEGAPQHPGSQSRPAIAEDPGPDGDHLPDRGLRWPVPAVHARRHFCHLHPGGDRWAGGGRFGARVGHHRTSLPKPARPMSASVSMGETPAVKLGVQRGRRWGWREPRRIEDSAVRAVPALPQVCSGPRSKGAA
jgi:hypothetical protein